jgi:hypothetical protein
MKKYSGRYYDMGRLCAVASERDLPSRREFALQCGEQIWRIPLQHIQQVYAPAKVTYHWLLGALIGLAVGAAVVEFIRWELNKPWEGGSTDNWFPSL